MLTALLIGLLIIIIFYFNRKPSSLPPGIWGWPIIGSLPSTDVAVVDQVKIHQKKFGDIFTWRIGSSINIYLCNYELIKKAMNMPELSDRPTLYTFNLNTNFKKIGIINSNGEHWRSNRRFALFHLKNLGMGKTTYESVILHEVSMLIKDLEGRIGDKPQPLPVSINVAIFNIIWRIAADKRYDIDGKEIQRFIDLILHIFKDVGWLVNMYNLIPWLPKVMPEFINKWGGANRLKAIAKEFNSYFEETIKEHMKVFDPENPRDFIDYYLIEMEAQKNNPESDMNFAVLAALMKDLFIAGTETSSSTLRWSIYYLAKYQEVQNKVHEELDAVVGRDDIPTLIHKERLPYFEAVCREIHRIVTLSGFSLPHAANKDVVLEGFTIPKGAAIMPCLATCHTDPGYWEKPNEFYPEHFLSKEGKLINRERLIPFGTGKRVCPGMALANMNIFLFLSGLLQKFHFSFPEEEHFNPKRNPKDIIVNTPKDYRVVITKRI